MKLLLVLMMLACRELVTVEWRTLLTTPARQWRDRILHFSQSRKESDWVVLAIIASVPALVVTALLVLITTEAHALWTYLLAAIVLVPVFADRQLPSVLLNYRQQWLNTEVIDNHYQRLAQARLELTSAYLQELFTPLFWLFLCDIWGIIIVSVYYSLRLSATQDISPSIATLAKKALTWFDWLPSRVLALSFALIGQFVETWSYWRLNVRAAVTPFDFVDIAATKAEPIEQMVASSPINLFSALTAYDALCYRSLVTWLVLLTLHIVL